MSSFLIIFFLVIIGLVVLICYLFDIFSKKHEDIYQYDNELEEINQENKKEKTISEVIKIPNDGTFIGIADNTEVHIPDNSKHIFTCGTTGSGKTVALANFIKTAVQKNYPLLIVDGKGDIGEGSILEITKSMCTWAKRKLYVINLVNLENSDTYNPFKDSNPTVCKDMLISMSEWSEEHYKTNTERYLQKLLFLMEKADIKLSFGTILEYLYNDKFIELSNDLVKKGLQSKEEHLKNLEISSVSGKIAEEAFSRFSLLKESQIGTIFQDNGIDILTALKENAVILFVLNPLSYFETSSLMGKLILIDSRKAVAGLFGTQTRKFFIYDEISTYASTSLTDLVNKSRSANITCILATQSLSDLDYAVNENYKEQIIENCNNYILLRQNSAVNAESWANIIGTKKTADLTYQIGEDNGRSVATGKGTVKFNKEYIFHPDEIKSLKTGEAFYISKDYDIKIKVKIHKPF
jgi:Type IV secretory pathway, VirD4 components